MTSPRSNGRTTPRKARVDFDLDKLEREGDLPDPFTFRMGDEVFTLADAGEIDYHDIVDMGTNPMAQAVMIARLLGDEQYAKLRAKGPLPQWKAELLMEKWQEHYGIPSPGEAAASSTS